MKAGITSRKGNKIFLSFDKVLLMLFQLAFLALGEELHGVPSFKSS